MPNKILVTGGTGCLGGACVEVFAQHGWSVISTSRTKTENYGPNVRHVLVDLTKPGAASELMEKERPDYFLHTAWHMTAGNWQSSGEDEFIEWVGITTELVKSFRKYGGKKAVCLGSATEYDWNISKHDEQSSRNPASFYGQTKACTGDLLLSYAERVGMPLVWARLFFMYGGAESANRLVPSVINSLLKNQEAITSSGTQIRDYLYAKDVANALYTIMDSDFSGAINVGSGRGVMLKEIVQEVGDIMGKTDLLRIGAKPQAVGDTPEVIADVNRLKALGFEPSYSLNRGLRESVAYWEGRFDEGASD